VTFEAGFTDAERAAAAATKVVAALAEGIKHLQRAAQEGDISKMRKASERLLVLLAATRQEVTNAQAAWPFSAEAEEIYLRDAYADEIMDAAKVEGLQIQRRDEGLVAFPCIVRILPSDRAVRIDRKKVQAVRPSRLVKTLKAAQSRKPRVAPEAFLEVLHRVYRLVAAKEYGTPVALAAVYEALTLLPGSTAAYDRTDFVRDLFILDRSGLTRTKSGAVFSLPASTGTKGGKGTYSFVAPNGEPVTYYGIRFTEAAS
jgi:hypothetical protein